MQKFVKQLRHAEAKSFGIASASSLTKSLWSAELKRRGGELEASSSP
jgi:hypothetical protein